jgi:hypothetical protein
MCGLLFVAIGLWRRSTEGKPPKDEKEKKTKSKKKKK